MAGYYFSVINLAWWPHLAGAAVYLFVRDNALTGPSAIYAGQTGEMSGYLGDGHRKWFEAVALGMTHILVHYEGSRPKRLQIETALRQQFRPPLNDARPRSPSCCSSAPTRPRPEEEPTAFAS